MAKRTAVIDIGSNSVRMVVFEKTSRFAFHLLHEAKSRVRISEGAYEDNGNLQESAIQRAELALRDFLSIANSYHVRKILCVATSAVRDAPNQKLFVKRINEKLKLNIKVIDGEKEAYLGGIACANLLPKMSAVTVDIGGGSTEFAYIVDSKITQTLSLDLGTVRIKELFFDHDDVNGAINYIDKALSNLPEQTCKQLIGVGGTFRALSRALMKRADYPLHKTHGYQFKAKKLVDYGNAILKADIDGLKALDIKKERFDVIKPGTLILLRVINHLQSELLTTSGVGVREGVFLTDLLRHNRHYFPENYNPSMRYLLDHYTIEPRQINNIAQVSKKLFDLLYETWEIPAGYREDLLIAAKLSKIGASLHFYSLHQHSYYLTQTALEYGYSHEQIMLISTLVRFQKRKRPKKLHRQAYETLLPDEKTLTQLSFILALSDALLSDHAQQIAFELYFTKKTITVESKKEELYLAKEAVEALEMPKGISVEFL
ncbi:MAG: Ppx/GppA phosphatase family protein [Campylobacterota bacterium]|nr:Ppx/GppA phosphatase family protein [Campylobacterota bacterium]